MYNDINNLALDDGQLDLDDHGVGDKGKTNVGEEGEERASVCI